MPFWDRCTTHSSLFSGDWDVHWGMAIYKESTQNPRGLLRKARETALVDRWPRLLRLSREGPQCYASFRVVVREAARSHGAVEAPAVGRGHTAAVMGLPGLQSGAFGGEPRQCGHAFSEKHIKKDPPKGRKVPL